MGIKSGICIYAHQVLLFQKPGPPFLPSNFLKVNTCPHLIISDFKILNIHNQILLRENNKVGCLSKTQINNQISFHTWTVLGSDLRNPKRGGYFKSPKNKKTGLKQIFECFIFKYPDLTIIILKTNTHPTLVKTLFYC